MSWPWLLPVSNERTRDSQPKTGAAQRLYRRCGKVHDGATDAPEPEQADRYRRQRRRREYSFTSFTLFTSFYDFA